MRACVEDGLLTPCLRQLCRRPRGRVPDAGFDALKAATEQHGVELLVSHMGLTGGVNIGPGAISVGFITAQEPLH